MKILFIVNDAPHGTEKANNAFRLAMMLQVELSTMSQLAARTASADKVLTF